MEKNRAVIFRRIISITTPIQYTDEHNESIIEKLEKVFPEDTIRQIISSAIADEEELVIEIFED